MPMTHAAETGARKLAPVSGAGFFTAVAKFLVPETNIATVLLVG